MGEAINALGNLVLGYIREQRQEGRVGRDVSGSDIVAGIEIVLETRKLYDLMADKDAPQHIDLARDGSGNMTFQSIPLYGVPRYAGETIQKRGYVKASRS